MPTLNDIYYPKASPVAKVQNASAPVADVVPTEPSPAKKKSTARTTGSGQAKTNKDAKHEE